MKSPLSHLPLVLRAVTDAPAWPLCPQNGVSSPRRIDQTKRCQVLGDGGLFYRCHVTDPRNRTTDAWSGPGVGKHDLKAAISLAGSGKGVRADTAAAPFSASQTHGDGTLSATARHRFPSCCALTAPVKGLLYEHGPRGPGILFQEHNGGPTPSPRPLRAPRPSTFWKS